MGIYSGNFLNETNEVVLDKDKSKEVIDEKDVDDDDDKHTSSFTSKLLGNEEPSTVQTEACKGKKKSTKSMRKKEADKAMGIDDSKDECGESCAENGQFWSSDSDLDQLIQEAKSSKKKVKEASKDKSSKYKKAAKDAGATDEDIDDKIDDASNKALKSAKKKSKKKKDKDVDSDDEKLAESYMVAAMKEAAERMNGKVISESSISSKYADYDRAVIETLAEGLMFTPIPKKKGLKEATKLKLKNNFVYPVKHPVYEAAVRKYMDISDNNTRVIVVSVNEEDQSRVLTALTGKLYDLIVDKADEIDYGDIPKSKGDITQVPNYDKIVECLDTMQEILVNYKQDTKPVDEINQAIDNIKERYDLFKKAFALDVELPIVMYNTMVMAIIASTSLMISSSIEFIKNPGDETFQVALDRVGMNRNKDNMLFENLKKFNVMCENKKFDETMNTVIQNSGKAEHLLGGGLTTVAVIAAGGVILFNILPILRELTYFFFYSKVRVSDYFNLQADLLQLNAENLKHSNREVAGADKQKVIHRQQAIAERFRKIADFLAVDTKKADVKATAEVAKDERKLKADEVVKTLPDSTGSALF